MKDNETFLREIYEKALEQQGRKNEKKWFTGRKFLLRNVLATGIVVSSIFVIASTVWKEEIQREAVSIAFSTEQGEQEIASQNKIEQFNDKMGQTRMGDEQSQIEVFVTVIQVWEEGESIRKNAVLLLKEKAGDWKKGEEIEVTFDSLWLSFSLDEGKDYTLQLEKMLDGTYAIIGGTHGF